MAELTLVRLLDGESGLENDGMITSLSSFCECARWDPTYYSFAAVAEHSGILRIVNVTSGVGETVGSFQLHLKNSLPDRSPIPAPPAVLSRPVRRPWRQFEFIPHRRGEILFFQAESSKILYAALPPDARHGSVGNLPERTSRVFQFGAHEGRLRAFAISSDGGVVASGSEDGGLKLWRLRDGALLGSCACAHNGGIQSVALAGNEAVVSGGADGVLRVWDLVGSSLRLCSEIHVEGGAPVTAVAVRAPPGDTCCGPSALGPEGAQHAPPADGLLHAIRDASREVRVGTGLLLAAGTADGVLHAYESAGGDHAVSWQQVHVAHHGSGGALTALAFRPDGRALAVGSAAPPPAAPAERPGWAAPAPQSESQGAVRVYSTDDWSFLGFQATHSPVLSAEYHPAPGRFAPPSPSGQELGALLVGERRARPSLLDVHLLQSGARAPEAVGSASAGLEEDLPPVDPTAPPGVGSGAAGYPGYPVPRPGEQDAAAGGGGAEGAPPAPQAPGRGGRAPPPPLPSIYDLRGSTAPAPAPAPAPGAGGGGFAPAATLADGMVGEAAAWAPPPIAFVGEDPVFGAVQAPDFGDIADLSIGPVEHLKPIQEASESASSEGTTSASGAGGGAAAGGEGATGSTTLTETETGSSETYTGEEEEEEEETETDYDSYSDALEYSDEFQVYGSDGGPGAIARGEFLRGDGGTSGAGEVPRRRPPAPTARRAPCPAAPIGARAGAGAGVGAGAGAGRGGRTWGAASPGPAPPAKPSFWALSPGAVEGKQPPRVGSVVLPNAPQAGEGELARALPASAPVGPVEPAVLSTARLERQMRALEKARFDPGEVLRARKEREARDAEARALALNQHDSAAARRAHTEQAPWEAPEARWHATAWVPGGPDARVAARAAEAGGGMPLSASKYVQLRPVDATRVAVPEEAARRLPKQVSPAWVASLDARPAMADMWSCDEHDPQVSSTRGHAGTGLGLTAGHLAERMVRAI